jgi:polysaccharide chain length determinant protein (PEP-CTERM system associated)
MIENRELNLDDYLAILRRRLWVILIPTLLAPLLAFGISFLFPPKYTSQSLVLVEEQKVPQGYVKSVVTEDLAQRIATLEQQILSRNRLQPMIERLGLAKRGNVDDVIEEIRKNVAIDPVDSDMTSGKKKKSGQPSDVPGFYLSFTADNPRTAQQVCGELTSMLLEENLKSREQVAQGTTDFISRQLEEAKRNLDDQDSKLAGFKRQYMGQLPGDEDNNLRLLMGMNSQLDANTQTLNRAQQDKTYAESVLAQQLAAWKTSETTTSPQTLEQQLSVLQSQLITLQARYTADHPDVAKTKHDITELQKKLNEINSAKPQPDADNAKANVSEPPEIRQLRVQIHQYEQIIAQAGRDQKRLQEQIAVYQGRVALSPAIEEQYKLVTRDYDTAQKLYQDLLQKKGQSEMATDMERRQQGEQMRLLNPANLPESPSFPNRLLFAGGGVAAGLALGLGIAMWFELRDSSLRTEQDVEAALTLPVLVSVPWLGEMEKQHPEDGNRKWWGRSKNSTEERKETIEV